MDSNGEQEDADKSKVKQSMHHNGGAAGLKVAELHEAVAARQLEKQPRRQEYKQYHRHKHRPPIRHYYIS